MATKNVYHIALPFFASFLSPSSLLLLNPKKLFFFLTSGLAPPFAPDITTALALAAGLM